MAKINLIFIGVLILQISVSQVSGQSFKSLKNVDEKTRKLFEDGQKFALHQQFGHAKAQYRKTLERTPEFQDAMLELAGIYFQQKMTDSSEYYLKEIKKINPKPSARVLFTLANIYFSQAKYKEALAEFDAYLGSDVKNSKSVADAEQMRENCLFAIQAMDAPKKFSPEPLGPAINTTNAEYLPSISADGKLLVFSRMVDRQEDLYFSTYSETGWSDALPMSEINTPNYNEAGHCISADGRTIVFTGCNLPNGLGSCDLYISKFKNGQWSNPENLGPTINSKYWESQPSLSANGRMLYFSSERPLGFGKKDIWYSELSPNNKWSEPINIGRHINTTGSEGSPFIHPDQQTLYFMSNGWPGMGGTDLFLSRRQDDTSWADPYNLGYPINTVADEGALVVSLDGKTAYFTSSKGKGLTADKVADTDLFKFELDERIRPKEVTYFQPFLRDDSTNRILQGLVTITSLEDNQNIFYSPTQENGSVLACLPKGHDYGIQLIVPGYVFVSEQINLPDSNVITRPFTDTFFMTKAEKALNKPFVMKNIFFESGSAELKQVSNNEINALTNMMNESPELIVEILGHTDNVGRDQDNIKLSELRASAVVNALVTKGVKLSRLKAIGYGETKPVADNVDEKGRQLNRRIEFRLVKKTP